MGFRRILSALVVRLSDSASTVVKLGWRLGSSLTLKAFILSEETSNLAAQMGRVLHRIF